MNELYKLNDTSSCCPTAITPNDPGIFEIAKKNTELLKEISAKIMGFKREVFDPMCGSEEIRGKQLEPATFVENIRYNLDLTYGILHDIESIISKFHGGLPQ